VRLLQVRNRAPCVCGAVALLAACSSGPSDPPPPPSEACVNQPVTQLAVAAHLIIDPATSSGCLRLPEAGASGASYLLVLASTSATAVKGPYLLRSSTPAVPLELIPPALSQTPAGLRSGGAAGRFEQALRNREEELAADPANRPVFSAAPRVAVAPPVGDVRSFKVCSNLTCTSFTTVMATARYVGPHSAVYIDNTVPQNDPLQDADFANLGGTFDTRHYPIDTTAFGRESDIDGNGVVLILMTDAVNALTPDCTDGRVIGFFFGGDLLTGPNSNRAEIFYTLVPEPARATNCKVVTRTAAVNNLKPTLIHEFQHMISFNQHVLIRSGNSEQVWLNEAMSHFAEELGGRKIPDVECIGAGFNSCRSLYTGGNILDSYNYLKDTESHYMLFPSGTQGTLEERGAVWLFLRWTLDHFSPDTTFGTPTTRALVATSLTGVANLTAVTAGSFSDMVPRWLMAAYLDDGPDLPFEPTGWLRFHSWGLRAIWEDPRNQTTANPPGPFNGFPLVPLALGGAFSRADTLKSGSGRHFLITQTSGGPAIDLQVLKNSAGSPLDGALRARFGIVRIR
jgi:hypothetical protein